MGGAVLWTPQPGEQAPLPPYPAAATSAGKEVGGEEFKYPPPAGFPPQDPYAGPAPIRDNTGAYAGAGPSGAYAAAGPSHANAGYPQV